MLSWHKLQLIKNLPPLFAVGGYQSINQTNFLSLFTFSANESTHFNFSWRAGFGFFLLGQCNGHHPVVVSSFNFF